MVYKLQQTMRWYGPNDPVALSHIAQAGCTGVVSALHAIPVGDIWPVEAIEAHRQHIEEAGLQWLVVESLPVHEDIKTGKSNRDLLIQNYIASLRNLAACGIRVVTYNFMPLLDWLRTDVSYTLPNGAQTLVFNKTEYAVFDLFILKRPGAEAAYSPEMLREYQQIYSQMSSADLERLRSTLLLGLPGSEVPFTIEETLDKLKDYQSLTNKQLKENLFYFLKAITPIADDLGVKMAIHPDDPPFSVLGLPRIVSTDADIEELMQAVPNASNGLCFCTGSLGAIAENQVESICRKWASRIYFLHLRNVAKDALGNFMEASHLEGDTDMYEVMKSVVETMQTEQRSIPMRPDHGHKMLDDLGKKTFAGYSAIGRLKGLAELRGLEYALLKNYH